MITASVVFPPMSFTPIFGNRDAAVLGTLFAYTILSAYGRPNPQKRRDKILEYIPNIIKNIS